MDGLSADDLSRLEKLIPVVGTLVTIASNPAEWLRENLRAEVFALIAEWVVAQALGALAFLIDGIILIFGRLGEIITDAGSVLVTPIFFVQRKAVGAINAVFQPVIGQIEQLGIAAPVAQLIVTLIVATVGLAVLAYLSPGAVGLIKTASDTLEEIQK